MEFGTVIFRRGIESKLVDNRWQLSNACAEPPATFPSWKAIQQSLGTPPVAFVAKDRRFGFGARQPWLVNPRTGHLFDVEVAELLNRPTTPGILSHIRRLQYGLGAMVYHCRHLAISYVRMCQRMTEISRIPGMAAAPGAMFGGNEEPNFEFDALVTVARRIYDAPRGLLWRTFGGRHGQLPGDIETVLQRLRGMPEPLREQLLRSWNEHGKVARDYRDCILHHADSEFGFGSVHMQNHPLSVWSAFVRIPDNPDAKSRTKFTYGKELDALDFSIDLTAEVSAYVTAVVEAATTPSAPAPDILERVIEPGP